MGAMLSTRVLFLIDCGRHVAPLDVWADGGWPTMIGILLPRGYNADQQLLTSILYSYLQLFLTRTNWKCSNCVAGSWLLYQN